MKPVWPIVVKHHEDHELIYINNESDWLQDDDLSTYPYADEDVVIDSTGRIFSPSYDKQSKTVSLFDLEKTIPMDEFNGLLRKHLCIMNECCISKITVSLYEQGFELIRSNTTSF